MDGNLRCKGCYTNTGTDEHDRFVFQEILAGATEWAVHHDTGQDTIERRVRIRTDEFSLFSSFAQIATKSSCELFREVTDDTHMDRDIILLWCARESERVPLEVRYVGTVDEDVLSCSGLCVVLLDLNLDDFRRVLNDFGNERSVP